MVLFFGEDGKLIDDVRSASERTGQAALVQKYGRYYTLIIVRYIAEIFRKLTHMGAYERGVDALFGHYELFHTFTVDDTFLLNRKVWPLS